LVVFALFSDKSTGRIYLMGKGRFEYTIVCK
jgi:hypothetical protein